MYPKVYPISKYQASIVVRVHCPLSERVGSVHVKKAGHKSKRSILLSCDRDVWIKEVNFLSIVYLFYSNISIATHKYDPFTLVSCFFNVQRAFSLSDKDIYSKILHNVLWNFRVNVYYIYEIVNSSWLNW